MTADKKIKTDLIWSYGSFAVMAASGILMNVLIAYLYDSATLGAFNQVFTIYLVLSQISALGIHFSVLRSVSAKSELPNETRKIVASGMCATFFIGVCVGALLCISGDLVSSVFDSAAVRDGLLWAGLSLSLAGINKAMLSALNGIRAIKMFSGLQAFRFVVLLSFIPVPYLYEISSMSLAPGIFVAEVALFLGLVVSVARFTGIRLGDVSTVAMKEHLRFGVRSFPSGMLIDLNTRIDVLLLGVFTSDRLVGIYSFVAMIAEGLIQSLIVVRHNINPLLVPLVTARDWKKLGDLIRRTRKTIYPIAALVSLLVGTLFPIFMKKFSPDSPYLDGAIPLVVLVTGIAIMSGYSPFDSILNQSGFPGTQSLQNLVVVTVNFCVSLLLIPSLGLLGAALSVAMTQVSSVVVTDVLSRKRLRFSTLLARQT